MWNLSLESISHSKDYLTNYVHPVNMLVTSPHHFNEIEAVDDTAKVKQLKSITGKGLAFLYRLELGSY